MIERIEKVAPIKPIEYDISRSKDEQDTSDRQKQNSFQEMLQVAMRKNAVNTEAKETDAYALDVNRATQSLFYTQGLNIRWMTEGTQDSAG